MSGSGCSTATPSTPAFPVIPIVSHFVRGGAAFGYLVTEREGTWWFARVSGDELTRDRMVIIGDTAHAAALATGQGASMALEDAVVLAKALRDMPDPPGYVRGARAASPRPGGGQHSRERGHERQLTAGRCVVLRAAHRRHHSAARLEHACHGERARSAFS
ncbi:MAG: FAD-dependent monooxygenase [Pseudonocardiaceae bacterium]